MKDGNRDLKVNSTCFSAGTYFAIAQMLQNLFGDVYGFISSGYIYTGQ